MTEAFKQWLSEETDLRVKYDNAVMSIAGCRDWDMISRLHQEASRVSRLLQLNQEQKPK